MKMFIFMFTFMFIVTAQSTIIEVSTNFTYLPNVTELPIELICNVTGTVIAWEVGGTDYLLDSLIDGNLAGHNVTGTNLLVNNSLVNNTEYICVYLNDGGTNTRSDPTYIFIAGVPDMVPDVKVNNNSVGIKGNFVNLTLCWGEPFNNLDNILHYKVSCSGDRCPPDDNIDGNTRKFRNLNSNYTYTFSVVATNSVGSGDAGEVNYTTPVIKKVTGVDLTCMLVKIFEHYCSVTWQNVTEEDIIGYLIYYYDDILMNVTDATTNSYSFSTIDISFPPAPMDVHTLTVNVSVAALNRHGEGPRSEPDTEVINATTPVTTITERIPGIVNISRCYNHMFNCSLHPYSMATYCEVTVSSERMSITNNASIPNGTLTTTVTVIGLKCERIYRVIARALYSNGSREGPGLDGNDTTTASCPATEPPPTDPPVPDWGIAIIVVVPSILFTDFVLFLLLWWIIYQFPENTVVITIIVVAFIILTFGLGYFLYQWLRNSKDKKVSSEAVQMDKDKQVHLDKPSDVYDSPGLKQKDIAAGAENQALYSYARTGPVNVVIPGSANS